jgi:hypothetical protein
MSTVQRPQHQSNGNRADEGKEELDLRAKLDLERVSSMLDAFNPKSRDTSMNDWMQTMQSFGEEIATLEPKLTFISKSVRNELFQIKEKEEGELRECFERQIDDYRKVRCLEKTEVESLTPLFKNRLIPCTKPLTPFCLSYQRPRIYSNNSSTTITSTQKTQKIYHMT